MRNNYDDFFQQIYFGFVTVMTWQEYYSEHYDTPLPQEMKNVSLAEDLRLFLEPLAFFPVNNILQVGDFMGQLVANLPVALGGKIIFSSIEPSLIDLL